MEAAWRIRIELDTAVALTSCAHRMLAPPLSVSVIIPTHDTRVLTLKCLAALAASRVAPAEVWVVDDASVDGTAEAVAREFPSVRLLDSGGASASAAGFTAAINRAWPLVSGDLVLLLNSDADVDPDAIGGFVSAFTRAPRLGVAGASLRYPDGRPQWSAGREPDAAWLFALASGAASALGRVPGWRSVRRESQAHESRADESQTHESPTPESPTPESPTHESQGHESPTHESPASESATPESPSGESRTSEPPSRDSRTRTSAPIWVPATAMAVRREVRDAIGSFDSDFTLYAQDLDYCTRARAAGWDVAQLHDVHVTHLLGGTIGSSPHAVSSRQDPVALYTDLARWIDKRHRQTPARARTLRRALEAGTRARLAARRIGRWTVAAGSGERDAWDRETDRYRAALDALRALPRR